jgi:predicted nucleic acid-binding protein
MARYYLDTCIWRDYYEERIGPGGRPLGSYAFKLIMRLISNKDEIIISNAVFRELESDYSEEEITLMLGMISKIGRFILVKTTDEGANEASAISKVRILPFTDVLHAITARNNNAMIISQDKHFQKLKDIVRSIRPDDLI